MTQIWNRRTTSSWSRLLMSLLCLAVAVTGCTSSDESSDGQHHDHDHDHSHHAESYTAALASIKQARDEVKQAFDAGEPHQCDEALHQVAELLLGLPEIAAETDLPKEDWQVVKEQSKVLFDAFMKIHDGFHGDEKQPGASYESVAETVNGAIEALESKIASTGEEVGN